MYEPYEYKKESKIKKFLNDIRDRFIAFTQELHFKEIGPNKWIIVFIPLMLLLLVGLTYTGYVTYTGRITEAQSKIMIMERQVEGLQSELNRTNTELIKCSSNLDATKSDLASIKTSLEEAQKTAEMCSYEREDLINQLNEKQEELNDWILKYNSLEANYKTIQCNFFMDKGCVLYYTLKNNKVECVTKIGDKYYISLTGIEVPEEQVKTC